MEWVKAVLEQSPLLALFAAIGLGYALGQILIAGFSLGVGAVLFAGLALGALAPGSVPPGLVNSIGLAMFLYGVGIQYGRAFFAGLSGPALSGICLEPRVWPPRWPWPCFWGRHLAWPRRIPLGYLPGG